MYTAQGDRVLKKDCKVNCLICYVLRVQRTPDRVLRPWATIKRPPEGPNSKLLTILGPNDKENRFILNAISRVTGISADGIEVNTISHWQWVCAYAKNSRILRTRFWGYLMSPCR